MNTVTLQLSNPISIRGKIKAKQEIMAPLGDKEAKFEILL